MTRSFALLARAGLVAVLVASTGCASLSTSGPLVVEILDTGYLIDNSVLASSAELQAYLADRGAKQVRFAPSKAATDARIAEATTAAREAGASVVAPTR